MAPWLKTLQWFDVSFKVKARILPVGRKPHITCSPQSTDLPHLPGSVCSSFTSLLLLEPLGTLSPQTPRACCSLCIRPPFLLGENPHFLQIFPLNHFLSEAFPTEITLHPTLYSLLPFPLQYLLSNIQFFSVPFTAVSPVLRTNNEQYVRNAQ